MKTFVFLLQRASVHIGLIAIYSMLANLSASEFSHNAWIQANETEENQQLV